MSPELLVAAGGPTIIAVLGYGALRQQVKQHDKELEKKASSERVDTLHESLDEVKRDVRLTTQEIRSVNEKLAVLVARKEERER